MRVNDDFLVARFSRRAFSPVEYLLASSSFIDRSCTRRRRVAICVKLFIRVWFSIIVDSFVQLLSNRSRTVEGKISMFEERNRARFSFAFYFCLNSCTCTERDDDQGAKASIDKRSSDTYFWVTSEILQFYGVIL